MPDEKVVADAPETKASVKDETSEPLGTETKDESTETGEEKADTSDTAEESLPSDETDGEDDIGEFLPSEDVKKDNVQRRIDQLTAQLKQAREELAQAKSKSPETKGEPEYSEAQLRMATKKAMEEGDPDLLADIMDYRVKQMERNLVKKYEDTERQKYEQVNRVQSEWNKVCMDYSKVWDNGDWNEIYQGAKHDLNILDDTSLLYRLALEYYNTRDEDGNYPYRVTGGQKMAVADALTAILRKKRGSPTDKSKKKLERALAKEKRKKSLSGGGALDSDAPSTTRAKDALSEYMEDRLKTLRERK